MNVTPSDAISIELPDLEATEQLGGRLASATRGAPGLLVGLEGPLGAGKTSLVRGLLRGLGVTGTIRSPTYTLVEPYECGAGTVYHLDLYRLAEAGELTFLGWPDLAAEAALTLVEWPERAGEALAGRDLTVAMDYAGAGRVARLQPGSEAGRRVVRALCAAAIT